MDSNLTDTNFLNGILKKKEEEELIQKYQIALHVSLPYTQCYRHH